MAFNPTTTNLNYQKYSGVVPVQQVELSFSNRLNYSNIANWEFITPNWLTAIFQDSVVDDEGGLVSFIFTLTLNSNFANNLPIGLHQSNYKVKFNFSGIGAGLSNSVTYTSLVTAQITTYIPLSISQSAFTFQHYIDEPVPDAEYLQITTQNNWSLVTNKPWLVVSETTGIGSQMISIGVNSAGMSPGLYTANFLVDDGNSSKQGAVNYLIRSDGTEEDYISVTPEQILFSEAVGASSQSNASISVDTSENLTLTSTVNWLQLETTNLPSGASTFLVHAQNTQILQAGSYPAEINLEGQNVSFSIQVLLLIVEESSSGLSNFSFYFAHARNRLNLTNGTPNAEVILDFTTQGTLSQKKYKKKIPYFQNSLSTVIGLETETLLKPQELPPLFTHFFRPIIPIQMDLKIYNKTIGSPSNNLLEEYFGLKWINGKHPKISLSEFFNENDIEQNSPNGNHFYRLTYLPKKQYLPKDAVIAFSVYSQEPLPNAILYANGINYVLNVNVPHTNIYTCFVNLSDYNVNVGDKLFLNSWGVYSDIVIKEASLPTNQIIWLNEWDCPEIFNCTGKLVLTTEDGNEEATFQQEGREYTKTIGVKEPRSFKIDTGEIYNQGEINFLSSIIRSKKIWLQLEDKRYEVIKNFRSIDTFESRKFENDFSLNFDLAKK
ncbi:hypothetical protein [Mesonia aestuariivivens]|uniref:BACON domain-containing protein n=1 Tax=Mesonia aestuariivivens TaxID=2796128 RepID=A0ABS6W3M9_9FLAO|nr:hypothetical protein [Mesonia aestuariivivens]MBW2962329.1 hypothetical protein [Mesonia aestuariivivens]